MFSTHLTKALLRTTDTYITALKKAGFETVKDLLFHFPREYEDRTEVIDNFSLLNIKEANTILVTLLSISNTRTAGNKILTKAVFEDKNGFLSEAVWFNRKYLSTQLQGYVGKKLILSGKVKYAFGKVTFQSPDTQTDLTKIAGEIVPVYPEINYIPTKWIAQKIEILQKYITQDNIQAAQTDGILNQALPVAIEKKYSFISLSEALLKIHFPKNSFDISEAKRRLGYEELYAINYHSISEKHRGFENSLGKSLVIPFDAEYVKEILSWLPFELTNHQKIALFQILKDMEKAHAMQRLLEGDVGTGKTVVAVVTILHAIRQWKLSSPLPLTQSASSHLPPSMGQAGEGKEMGMFQVAIMAPTAILATQHFLGMQTLLFEHGVSSELLVGATTASQKKEIKHKLKTGNLDVIIGTHALVQEDVIFKNLGLVIIDEQHRFGVKQREVLEQGFGNVSGVIPHSLNMTATPIPRTLAFTLYGNQDLSVINEYPKGRKEIFTKIAATEDARYQIELFIRSELEKGRQVYWVSPLVEESEKVDLANALAVYENLREIFAPFGVGLIHGKMKAKEKDVIMADFKENKIQILSATSVIEVGIDVPNASIICIEGAERFGLSQLHQIRGRVGRGQYQSYCYLFPSKGQKTERLKAMEQTNNGFELSEIDLELRGPGEVYGVRQSGVPDLKVASLTDLELISQIREDIEEMFIKK